MSRRPRFERRRTWLKSMWPEILASLTRSHTGSIGAATAGPGCEGDTLLAFRISWPFKSMKVSSGIVGNHLSDGPTHVPYCSPYQQRAAQDVQIQLS